MDEKNSYKVTQDLEIMPPKKVKGYPISMGEWNYIKNQIKSIGEHLNIFQTIGAVLIGFSGSAFLSIITMDFARDPGGTVSTKFVVCFSVAVGALIIGLILFLFGRQQKKDKSTKAANVVSYMETIENRFIDEKEKFSEQSELEIIEAIYGTDKKNIDVTEKLRRHVFDNTLTIQVSNLFFGSDPDKGTTKKLRVTYSFAGKTHEKTVIETQGIYLP